MFESDSDEEVNLSYKSVTDFTKKEDVPLKLWAEHFSKPEKERIKSLSKIFEKEFHSLKKLYCFLENDQVMGKTLTKLGIPNICGKIDKKFFKLSSKHGRKVNKYERRNKTYLSKPHLLSKKIYLKPSGLKGQNATSRYPPVVERWSDLALKKFKSNQKISSAQSYTFENDHTPENSKHGNPAVSTAPVVGTQDELPNKPVDDSVNQEREEVNENPRPVTTVLIEPRGLLRKNDNKYGFKKSVRFNDNDLCSFAPTQEFSAKDLTKELPNSEAVFDDLLMHQLGLSSPDYSKTYKTDSDKTIQRSSSETTAPKNTSTTLLLEKNNVQESVDKCQTKLKKSIEKENKVELDFEVEPYDDVVIEEFTESNSVGIYEMDHDKSKALDSASKVTESTNQLTFNPTETPKTTKQIGDELFVSNNLEENPEARVEDQKQAEEKNETVKKTENYILSSKTTLKIKQSENLSETQNENIARGNIVDIHDEKYFETSSIMISVNSKTNNEDSKLTNTSDQNPSQQQSVRYESKDSVLIAPENKNTVVPESSSEDSTDNKSSKSDVLVEETPSSNENEVDCKSLTVNRTSENLLMKEVENYVDQESVTKSSLYLVNDWSDDEFIPLSPLQLPNQNENSTNITAIDGNIISIEGNNALSCTVNKDIHVNSVLYINVKNVDNRHNISGMLSPCDSLSDRDYMSDSSEYGSDGQLSSTLKHECSNTHSGSQNVNFKTIHEIEIRTASNNFVGENSEILSNDICNHSSLLEQTIKHSSDMCTPSESQTRKIGLKEGQTSFGAKAPCKADNKSTTGSSTVDKSQQENSQKSNNVSILGVEPTVNSINPIQTLGLENKVRKILFPLQTQPSVCGTKVEDEISPSKQVWMTSKVLNILTRKGTENQINKKPLEDEEGKENCLPDVNIIDGVKNLETVYDGLCKLNQKEDSFRYSPVSMKSSSGSPPNDVGVKENFIECDKVCNNEIQFENSNITSCKQRKDEDSFSDCSSTKNEGNIMQNLSKLNECDHTLLELPSEKDVNKINTGFKNREIIDNDLSDRNHKMDSLEYSPVSLKSSSESPPNDVAVIENHIECDGQINKEVQIENPNFISCTPTKDDDSFSVCSSPKNEDIINLSLHNECAHTLLEQANVKELFSQLEASPIETNSKNAQEYLHDKTFPGSEMDISLENTVRSVSPNRLLSLQNKNDILVNDDILDEPNQVQNSNWFFPSSENEIIVSKQLTNYKENKTSDKLDSPLGMRPIKTDSINHLEANQVQDDIVKFNKGTSLTTIRIPVREYIKESNQLVCENMITDIRLSSNTLGDHKNQTFASVTAASHNAMKTLSGTEINIQPSQKENVHVKKCIGLNIKENKCLENNKSSSKTKNDVFQTIDSIKVSDDTEQNKNNELIFENAELTKNVASVAGVMSSLSISTESIPICSGQKITASDNDVSANTGNKRIDSLTTEPQIQINQNLITCGKTSNIDSKEKLTMGKRILPKIKGETHFDTKIISLNNKMEQEESSNIVCENNDFSKEATIFTSNKNKEVTNIRSHSKNTSETVSDSDSDQIEINSKSQGVVASSMSHGKQSTEGSQGSIKRNTSGIRVISTTINVNTPGENCFTKTTDLMAEKSLHDQNSHTSKSNERLNLNEIDFTQKKETPGAIEVPKTQKVNMYATQTLRNENLRGLRVIESNQSQTSVKEIEKIRNGDSKTMENKLNENSSVPTKMPMKNEKLYSSNTILLSNYRGTNRSKLSNSGKGEINIKRKDDKKYSKIILHTTSSIPVIPSWNDKENKISQKGAKYQESKSLPGQTKKSKGYQALVSGNTVKLQNHAPKLDIIKQKMFFTKIETPTNNENSNQFKTKSIIMSTDLSPVNDWHKTEEQAASVHSRSTEKELKKKSPGIFVTTGNLGVIVSSSHCQGKPVLTGSTEICNEQKRQNATCYESLSKVKILNKQEKSCQFQANQQSKMEKQTHHEALIKGLSPCRIENKAELLEEVTNTYRRKKLNTNFVSYTSSNIKTQIFSDDNSREAKNCYEPQVENSPPDSDNESLDLEDKTKNSDKRFSMSYDRFQSLLSSDDESIEDLNASNVDSADGNFSPLSSPGSDMILNNSKNAYKSSTKQLKRKFLKNLDDYSSDELDCGESPSKCTKPDVMSSPSSEKKTTGKNENNVYSDEFVPSLLSDKSDDDNRYQNDLDSVKTSDFNSTMISDDSPLPPYSDEFISDHFLSSPTCPNDDLGNSPLCDMQSSDDDRSDKGDFYLTDMFDD